MASSELIRLRDVLAHLYPSAEEARRVLKDAGMNTDRVEFRGGAVQVWFSALEEAERSSCVADIVCVASRDYPKAFKGLSAQRTGGWSRIHIGLAAFVAFIVIAFIANTTYILTSSVYTGMVRDHEGLPVRGARVDLGDPSCIFMTNEAGYFFGRCRPQQLPLYARIEASYRGALIPCGEVAVLPRNRIDAWVAFQDAHCLATLRHVSNIAVSVGKTRPVFRGTIELVGAGLVQGVSLAIRGVDCTSTTNERGYFELICPDSVNLQHPPLASISRGSVSFGLVPLDPYGPVHYTVGYSGEFGVGLTGGPLTLAPNLQLGPHIVSGGPVRLIQGVLIR